MNKESLLQEEPERPQYESGKDERNSPENRMRGGCCVVCLDLSFLIYFLSSIDFTKLKNTETNHWIENTILFNLLVYKVQIAFNLLTVVTKGNLSIAIINFLIWIFIKIWSIVKFDELFSTSIQDGLKDKIHMANYYILKEMMILRLFPIFILCVVCGCFCCISTISLVAISKK